MKAVVLWIGAGLFALYLLLRYRKGANRRLAGKMSTRFVHQVSVLLVAAGCGAPSKQDAEPVIRETKNDAGGTEEKGEGDIAGKLSESADVTVAKPLKTPYPDFFPHTLQADRTNNWLAVQAKRGEWAQFKQHLVAGNESSARPGHLGQALSDFVAVYENENATTRDLLRALHKTEEAGVFDTWLAGHLYQRASLLSVDAETANLFSRMESHSRVAESFVIALAHAKVVQPRAWMSKAAPPAGYNRHPTLDNPVQFLKDAAAHYGKEDGGSWETQSRVAAKLEEGSAVLVRRGESVSPQGGFFLRRLDVLVTKSACKLRIPFLGGVAIPEGTTLTSRSLYGLLSPAAKQLLQSYVTRALAGDQEALGRLSRLTPLAYVLMREALANNSDSKGAPAIRSLLFDASW